MNPVLTLDLQPSRDSKVNKNQATISANMESKNHENSKCKYSLVAIAGTAADASDQLDLAEDERGTVAVVKATMAMGNTTTTTNEDDMNHPIINKRIHARIRAKVGTCKISEDSSFLGKPGVGVCRFRPDGSCFAVGGWDRRIRIYSRTTAKLLGILRGPNEDSITTLDWAVGDDDLMHAGVLAAGSSDGKITLWRT
mmetsp:Transcript_9481/g.14117  ORF Transcript_9481/g.14117 Transcript_9481/m.14117 type:complete len:197 (+) Transcript_9481:1-591(+)